MCSASKKNLWLLTEGAGMTLLGDRKFMAARLLYCARSIKEGNFLTATTKSAGQQVQLIMDSIGIHFRFLDRTAYFFRGMCHPRFFMHTRWWIPCAAGIQWRNHYPSDLIFNGSVDGVLVPGEHSWIIMSWRSPMKKQEEEKQLKRLWERHEHPSRHCLFVFFSTHSFWNNVFQTDLQGGMYDGI